MSTLRALFTVAAAFLILSPALASVGDRLPQFHECLQDCTQANCHDEPTPIPLLHKLLLWNCPSECDYACQHLTTTARLSSPADHLHPIQQYHGKWPFHRFLGMQEPFSVLFSLLNLAAHIWGVSQLRAHVPSSYKLRRYYIGLGGVGYLAWTASAIFHTRDFNITEKTDYFMAGLYVLYGLYFAPMRIFRLDDPSRTQPWRGSVVRIWTLVCVVLYVGHVTYLTAGSWDYTYNMTANIIVGVLQNILWIGFSIWRYSQSGQVWHLWPAMICVVISSAMSLEVLDFPPWGLMVDAHSLWHLGTVLPTVWWYLFLLRDAEEDTKVRRLD